MRGVLRRKLWLGYLLAGTACLAAFVGRQTLDHVFPPGFPFVTFFPAVIITAYLAGRGPGLACVVLCALVTWYFFLPPFGAFVLDSGTGLALGFFIAVASLIALLIGHMTVVTERLEAERARSARLYEQERVLFQELQHRVANNMQFVASLLHLQKRQLSVDPESAARALDEASQRIETMSRVHRRLYDASAAEVPIDQHLREICDDVLAASPQSRIACHVTAEPLQLDVERLMIVSLIATEVVTNCLKHAFIGRAAGIIDVRFARIDAGTLELSISDNGRGLPEGYDATGTGLGTRILRGLAAQIDGSVTMSSDDGTVTRLRFPAERGKTARAAEPETSR